MQPVRTGLDPVAFVVCVMPGPTTLLWAMTHVVSGELPDQSLTYRCVQGICKADVVSEPSAPRRGRVGGEALTGVKGH